MARKLDSYRDERDPTRTKEPFGAEPMHSEPAGAAAQLTTAGRFVVHQHAATRMHYDLHVEVGGTLKSFAVPKGPSPSPAAKHLAVHTEDHPLEYLEFEAAIAEHREPRLHPAAYLGRALQHAQSLRLSNHRLRSRRSPVRARCDLGAGAARPARRARLTRYPKTSGQTGLHVLGPMGGAPFGAATALAGLLGRLVHERHPTLSTLERLRKNRPNSAYIDTGHTGRLRVHAAHLGRSLSRPVAVEPHLV